jgi:hypothetical protein
MFLLRVSSLYYTLVTDRASLEIQTGFDEIRESTTNRSRETHGSCPGFAFASDDVQANLFEVVGDSLVYASHQQDRF